MHFCEFVKIWIDLKGEQEEIAKNFVSESETVTSLGSDTVLAYVVSVLALILGEFFILVQLHRSL